MQRPIIDSVHAAELFLGGGFSPVFVDCVKFDGALAHIIDPAIIAENLFVKSPDKA